MKSLMYMLKLYPEDYGTEEAKIPIFKTQTDIKRNLKYNIIEVLKQNQYDTYPVDRQIIELFAAKNRYLEEFDIALIKTTLTKLYEHIVSSHHDIIDEINDKKILSDELIKKMNDVISSFIKTIK